MKVLFVASNIALPGAHGGTTHVSEVVGALRRRHQVLLVGRLGSCWAGTLGVGLVAPRGLRHAASMVTAAVSLPAVRRFDPDVIYERGSSQGVGAALSLVLGRPLLCMVLDNNASPLSLIRAGRIISTKPEIVPARYRDKVAQVHWGANTAMFHPEVDGESIRRSLELGDDRLVVYTGSFKRWHGLVDLIEAAAEAGEGVQYLLVGDGPQRAEVERQIGRLGLERRVHLVGQVPYEDVPRYVAAADVCVAPFRPEEHPLGATFGGVLDPLKVFEYLAVGRPVIATRLENIARIFSDPDHLLLVEPGRPEALAEALRRLSDDPALAHAMAEAGRELVLERYTWERHVEQLERLFDELVTEGP